MTYTIQFNGKIYNYDVLEHTPKMVTVRIVGDDVSCRVTVTIKRRGKSSKELASSCPTSITMLTHISTATPQSVNKIVDIFNSIAIGEEWDFKADTPQFAHFDTESETCN